MALAPAIAALVGIGAVELWRWVEIAPRVVLAVVLAGTVVWAFLLLNQAGWQPWLAWTVLVLGFAGTAGLLGVHRLGRKGRAGVIAVAVVAALAAPAGWSIATAATPHTGAIPSSQPARRTHGRSRHAHGRRPRRRRPAGRPARDGRRRTRRRARRRWPPRAGRGFHDGRQHPRRPNPVGRADRFLQQDADAYTWAEATVGSNGAAGYQLASGEPVMALGGFNGTDPFPTLERFQQLVAEGRVHYFVGEAGRSNTQSGGSDQAHRIGLWVEANFTPITIDGTSVYDLTQHAGEFRNARLTLPLVDSLPPLVQANAENPRDRMPSHHRI